MTKTEKNERIKLTAKLWHEGKLTQKESNRLYVLDRKFHTKPIDKL